MDFEVWKEKVDAILENSIGLTSDDLPDICYWDLWESGVTPRAAALEALHNSY